MSDRETHLVGRLGGPTDVDALSDTPLEAAERYARRYSGGTGSIFVIPLAHPDLLRFEQRTTVEAVPNA